MKKLCIPLVALFLLGVSQGFAQHRTDAYIFPTQPGTEAWKAFKTGQAMIEASQLPADVLSRISTEGLVATCLSYPLLSNTLAYNDLQSGFQAVTANFNGLQELLRRPDAGREVFKAYQKMNPNAITTKADAVKKGDFSLEFVYVELLMAQPAILEKLTSTERKSLLKESFSKFKAKDAQLDNYSWFTKRTAILLLGRILEKDGSFSAYQSGKSSAAMRAFLTTGQVQDDQIISQIIADTQTFAQ